MAVNFSVIHGKKRQLKVVSQKQGAKLTILGMFPKQWRASTLQARREGRRGAFTRLPNPSSQDAMKWKHIPVTLSHSAEEKKCGLLEVRDAETFGFVR
ncbi:hypothetical protein NPIL_108401 [Nephila pilipes]|uniref:Uncharacterized protein n=1 Tax=Nephila pilipes TaxID=299642 RepID=A0A8X6IUX9_NEPPI|nr:hypothetical protein NPIL_108401 [Nephila pilipes]